MEPLQPFFTLIIQAKTSGQRFALRHSIFPFSEPRFNQQEFHDQRPLCRKDSDAGCGANSRFRSLSHLSAIDAARQTR